jgi:ABC-type uncharacterized transport system substrate-binding protein
MGTSFRSGLVIGFMLLGVLCFSSAQAAQRYRVLVIMSYHETYPWGMEVKEGIDSILSGSCDLTYFYLDTKNNFSSGAAKAREAYEVYREFRPDGVIAADDAAQSLFVVPYLKDKVKTPVMFCGVNEDPEKYDFPTPTVSGILERVHVSESLAFLQQLVPSVKTFCAIMKEDPSSRGILRQIRQEADSYPARFVRVVFPKNFSEAVASAKQMRKECDVLFLTPMDGLPAADDSPLTTADVTPALVKAFGKPTISENAFNVKSGVLCAVIKAGQEQGATAASMLVKAMGGTPLKSLPVTKNRYGRRMINVTEMNVLGIKPRPVFLVGTEMVRTGD